jgi:predicted nucleic acid-binding protein
VNGIVFDATVAIAYLEDDDEHHEKAVRLALEHAQDGFLMNDYTVAEVLAGPIKEGRADEVMISLKGDLGVRAAGIFGDDWAFLLSEVRAFSNPRLKLPDAIVLATAIDMDAKVATFDEKLSKAAKHVGRLCV